MIRSCDVTEAVISPDFSQSRNERRRRTLNCPIVTVKLRIINNLLVGVGYWGGTPWGVAYARFEQHEHSLVFFGGGACQGA